MNGRGIFRSIQNALGSKPKKPKNTCPLCKNNSVVPWVMRLHEGSELTEKPTIYPVGLRCEKCSYTMVDKPMIVFHLFQLYDDAHPKNTDEMRYNLLLKAIERCVIDHRKDCIPQAAWDIIAPRVMKELAYTRSMECAATPTSPLSTPEYWEKGFSVIVYEAFGKCVWGLD